MKLLQLDSADDLESLALELGGAVTHKNGRVFNAAGRSGVARLPVRSATVAPPVPEAPHPVDRNVELMAKVIEVLARPVPVPVPPPEQPAKKVDWIFKVERDERGFLTQIVATSKLS